MKAPESPEALARALGEATSHFVADAELGRRVMARSHALRAVDGPAFVVLAFATALVFWLSFQGDMPGARGLGEARDAGVAGAPGAAREAREASESTDTDFDSLDGTEAEL